MFLFLNNEPNKGKTLLDGEKDYDNIDTSIFTDKRKSLTIDNSFQRIGSDKNYIVFTNAKRRKSDLSVNPLTSIMENRSSERSLSSNRPPLTPNNTGSSDNVDLENIQNIKVSQFSKISKKNKERIVHFLKIS